MKLHELPEPRSLDELRAQEHALARLVLVYCHPWLRTWARGAPMQTRSA
jgi:hypothetical protein